MKKVRFEKWQLIVLSVFYIVFGIISAAVPREQFLTFFHILGLIIMLIGAFSIFIYFLRRDYLQEHNFQVTFGVLYIMAGMIGWMKPELIVSNYPFVFAGCVVIDSAIRMQYAMNGRIAADIILSGYETPPQAKGLRRRCFCIK